MSCSHFLDGKTSRGESQGIIFFGYLRPFQVCKSRAVIKQGCHHVWKKTTCLQSLLLSWSMELFSSTQPPRVARKNGSSVGTRTRCTHVFARLGCRLARSVGALPTKSLNRSSGGSLLRASCCWLVGLGSKCFLTWLPRGS